MNFRFGTWSMESLGWEKRKRKEEEEERSSQRGIGSWAE